MTPQALESCSLPSYGNASASFAAVPDLRGHLSGHSLQPDSWLFSALSELSTPVCRSLPLLPRAVLVGVWVHQSREGGGNASESVRPRAQKHESTQAQPGELLLSFFPSPSATQPGHRWSLRAPSPSLPPPAGPGSGLGSLTGFIWELVFGVVEGGLNQHALGVHIQGGAEHR